MGQWFMFSLLDLLFPKECLNCRAGGKYICKKCLKEVEKASSVCPACKRFSPLGKTHASCKTQTSLDGCVAIWKYQGVIRKAILAFKYRFAFNIAAELVDSMIVDLRFSESIFCPIPLSKDRFNWRGFNQSELIAKLVVQQLENTKFIPNLLVRKQSSVHQAKLSKNARLRNIRGVFAVNTVNRSDLNFDGKKIFIVDDVWTTGATINEAAKVLKAAGAGEVWGLTVAR